MRELSPQTMDVRVDESTEARLSSKGWIAVAALAVVTYFIRDCYQFLKPQFWAEDATIFLAMSVREALLNLVHPYAGYFHFAPRTLALLGAFFPTVLAPAVFYYGAVAAAVASCVAIYLMVGTFPTHLRILFALAPMLVLPAGEVYGNVTNIQWFFGVAFGVLVLTYRGDTFRSRGWLVMGEVLALTGPFSVVFWPCLLVWSWLTGRLPVNAKMLVVVGIGAFVQLAAVVLMGVNKYGVGIAAASAWVRAVKIFVGSFVTLSGVTGGVAVLAIFVLLAFGLRRNFVERLRGGYLPFGLVCMALLTLLMGLWTHKHMPDEINPLGPGERYFFLPFNFLFMAVIASAQAVGKKYHWFCLVVALSLVFGWSRHFRKGELSDFRWRDYYALSQVTQDSLIPIQPGWVLRLNNDRPDRLVSVMPVDLSRLEPFYGVLHTDGDETTLIEERVSGDPASQIVFDVPSSCLKTEHRFVRVALKDAARVHLYLPDVNDISSKSASLIWHVGANDHWYFDVPNRVSTKIVRLGVTSDSGGIVRGLKLSWVCW
ncbi:putative membrane protein [Paraburkholderia xenovorans LB400]|jgi:hypothetical protein|uniref:Transmembrane protein n=1 Tax=Paraburkholderia xenovorans (strain LB400) TaxID=266265 RepID=Q144N7_PARXL|nr:hypothetical protein [Paraburkholderia xenovorans]ABE29202.1 hypothetical protein Bxe_A3796 [Paraburkholderia xenovorans LB400]AIP31098.1 putative membrane protein [Paraburkholderia xenovorans LB400]